MKNKKLLQIITAALFAALVTGLTFFPKIPIPGGGYVHLGDAMVYLTASFLPCQYALTAAAVGGGLADMLSGYVYYAPVTIVVKALLTLAFTHKNQKVLSKQNYLAPLAGLFITPVIYFFADIVLMDKGAALPGIIWNLCQAVASIIVYYIIATAFDKLELKKKLFNKLY